MSMVSFGDLAQSFVLKAQISRLKSGVARSSQELASGKLADPTAAVLGDYSKVSALGRSHDLITGYAAAAQEAAFGASAMQTVIADISASAQSIVSQLLLAPQNGSQGVPGILGDQARSRLSGVMASLNTSVAGRSLFAGIQVTGAAVTDSDAVLAALRIELAGVPTAEDAMNRISTWFDSPTGYGVTAYIGGAPPEAVAVSPTDTVWLGPTATEPGFREILKGLAAAALVDDGTLAFSDSEARSLAKMSGEQLLNAHETLATLGARIGVSEGRIEAAQARNSAEISSIEIAKSELLDSDPYKVATELEAVQTNLEMMYTITARLSTLHLTDFLR
jgi:flagellar hook-associated protein 3 FlgL